MPICVTVPFTLKVYFAKPVVAVYVILSPAQIMAGEAVSVPVGDAITVIFIWLNVAVQEALLLTSTVTISLFNKDELL